MDDLIPGKSTVEDLLQIIEELPEEKKPSQYGDSGYFYREGERGYFLIFNQGVLDVKDTPRKYLGNIINYYGAPVQVTWKVLNRSVIVGSGEPVELADSTTLFFPRSKALFSGDGQITNFSADTTFSGVELTSSLFDETYMQINNEVSTSEQFVQHFPWPCS